MRRLTTFCIALLTAATTFATVTYELNGGITNDYGWQGKGDMFAAFMTDAGATDFETLEYYIQQADPLGAPNICSKLTDASPAIKMTDKWGWLEAYIMAAHADQSADGASALTAGGAGAAWRYAVGAFFVSGQRTGWPKSADFSTLGQVAAFMPAWKHAFANPAEPKDSVALNEPYKEDYVFKGWYASADFTGEKVTYVDSTTTGTLYAKFIHKAKTMTCAEAAAAAMLLQSGEIGTDTVLVTGYVTNTDEKLSKGQQKFYMDDTKGTTKTFYAYWCNMPEGEENPLHVGDKVSIKGFLMNYNSTTAEMKNGDITILERVVVKVDTVEATVCEAVEEAEALNSGDYSEDVFKVAGVVTAVTSTNDTYNTASFTLTCEDNEKVLTAYNVTMENGFCAVGDSVLVIGKLSKYNSTLEILGEAEVTKKGIAITVNVAVASGCEEMGTVTKYGVFVKGSNVTITATPNAGYHFVEWSDGAGKPVRDIYLTSDTTIYATFALGEYGGKCGSNLYWEWNNGALTITGTGDMDVVNYQTWEDYNITISSISFPEGMTSISSAAFTDIHAIPSQAYLQTLQTANHQIVCIQFLEPVCNDIVWTGTYNDWSTELYELLYFQPVPNYDGWYYVNVPITNSADDAISWGKPVQLANDGSFSWDYQAGNVNSWEVIYGTITVSVGYPNESNLSNCVYDDGPLVLISKYFKNDPCTGQSDIKAHLASYMVRSVVIPASVTYIGENAFAGWTDLTHFEYKGNSLITDAAVLPDIWYLSYIRANAQVLEEVVSSDTVVVSNGYVSTVPTSTYYDLRNADNTSIVMSDFNDLRVLYLPDGLVWIGDDAFINDKHLEGITIPKDVISIGESAFENCRSLQSVTFAGTKVQAIGDWAFYNCHELQSITIPEGVTAIGKSAFYGCTYLTDLNLPSTVQSIADNGFALCSKLKKISVSAVTPPTIDAKTFEDVDKSIPLCVPVGTRQSYADAPYWQEFFNIQEEAPTAVSTTSAVDNTTVQKVLRNGQVLILRGDKVFTVMGVEVK